MRRGVASSRTRASGGRAEGRPRFWALVALGLLVGDLVVRGPFFEHHVVPSYVRAGTLIRERTAGHNWRVLFDGIARSPRPALRIALVGDSTVNTTIMRPDDKIVPARFLEDALRRRLPSTDLEVVDASQIGLYANDVALVVDKLVATDVDLIVYGLTLRALPAEPNARWSPRLTRQMTPADLWRIADAGGSEWLRRSVTPAMALEGIVQWTWATYAYRDVIKRAAWLYGLEPALASWPGISAAVQPTPFLPVFSPLDRQNRLEWTRRDYGIPNSNWTALAVIARLCRRHAPGRCLVYSGPLNPSERRIAEPHLYDEYVTRLRAVIEDEGVRFLDFTDLLPREAFRTPPVVPAVPHGDPIHMNPGGAATLADHLGDAIAEVWADHQSRAQRR